jgi:hypothetical protein
MKWMKNLCVLLMFLYVLPLGASANSSSDGVGLYSKKKTDPSSVSGTGTIGIYRSFGDNDGDPFGGGTGGPNDGGIVTINDGGVGEGLFLLIAMAGVYMLLKTRKKVKA